MLTFSLQTERKGGGKGRGRVDKVRINTTLLICVLAVQMVSSVGCWECEEGRRERGKKRERELERRRLLAGARTELGFQLLRKQGRRCQVGRGD